MNGKWWPYTKAILQGETSQHRSTGHGTTACLSRFLRQITILRSPYVAACSDCSNRYKFEMVSEQTWPRSKPVVTSYEVRAVIKYLETIVDCLAVLARFSELAPVDVALAFDKTRSVEEGWVEHLEAEVRNVADLGRALVAYVQLIGSFAEFGKPFERFVRRAAKQGTIPYVDIAFDAWTLKCILLCLKESGITSIVQGGGCSCRELLSGARRSMIVINVLIQGYKDRLA